MATDTFVLVKDLSVEELEADLIKALERVDDIAAWESESRAEYGWVDAGSYYTQGLYQRIANEKAKAKREAEKFGKEAERRGLVLFGGDLLPALEAAERAGAFMDEIPY